MSGNYYCDGVNDQVEIQAALNTGKPVILSDGNFSLSANLNFNNPVNLTGQGEGITVLSFSSAKVIRAYYINGINLSNITFHGIAATSTTGIFIQHSSNISITHVTFDGINVQITGGVMINDPSTIDSDNVLVQYSTFKNTPSVTNQWFALGNTATHFRILDNYFYNVAGSAIDVANSPYAIVSGNTIDGAYNSWFSGIYSEGGLGVQFTNNTIRNCPNGAAVMISQGNYGYGKGGNGTISGNIISNSRFGIGVIGVPGMTVTNNTITDMNWHGIYLNTATVAGVVYYPNGCTISNNIISGFGLVETWSDGVAIDNTQQTAVKSNQIDGKNYPNAKVGIAEGSAYSDYNTITNNTITGVPTHVTTVGPHTVATGN